MSKGTLKETYHKIMASTKQGLLDIKTVAQEGNYKLFLKQAVAIFLLILGFRYVNQSLDKQDQKVLGQISAVDAQQSNEKEYVAGKEKLLELEPRFPDLASKNTWLLSQVVRVDHEMGILLKTSSQTEDSNNSGYTVVSIPVEATASYADFGRLLAHVESKDEYLRISEFSLTKISDAANLGKNTIRMKMNTVFPKEKLIPVLFKDTVKQKGKEARKK